MDISLYRKGIFGMPLDKVFFVKIIKYFDENVDMIFHGDMIKISEKKNFENMGNFRISYKYIPHNYSIIIDNELRSFDISIVDAEGASNVLYRIKKYKRDLCEQNIIEALKILKNVLEQDNFNWYFHVDNKLYRKNADGIKRIKDIREILNG